MSTPNMRTLRLYGSMGAKFGRHYQFALDTGTPAEAVAALMSQVPGVREYLAEAKQKGIEFAVFVGKRNLTKDHLRLPANGEIRIAPVPAGAKRGGVLQLIAGVVLIVVGAWTENYGLVAQGVILAAGGVAQMLTPIPHGSGAKDGAGNQANYNFNGPINTQAQGNPVPLGYGRMKVGSAVISAGIDTLDTSYIGFTGDGPKNGFMGGGRGGDSGAPTIRVP